jgi:Ser/Thr protein kinase RdoA (MazF antagonist)
MFSAWQVAEQFDLSGQILAVKPFGHGLINDTYLVTLGPGNSRVILQRLNLRVFPQPQQIMANLRTVLDHIRRRQRRDGHALRDLQLPEIYTGHDGKDSYRDPEGGFWRALSFIEDTRCSDRIVDSVQAEEVGFALGRFHALVNDLDPRRLYDILPGFHVTPRYLERFRAVAARNKMADSAERRFCFAFIEARRSQAGVLEEARRRKLLKVRSIHGDPKLNNILFGAKSARAVSLVDLDTVKPGLSHYDIGDCLRSCCNSAGECPGDTAAVDFDLDLCRAILKGYCEETRSFLNEQDYAYLYEAIRLIPFELGLRFLTDYLEGNQYFKVNSAEQNLHRALTQFQLTASIEAKEAQIRQLIVDLR